MIHLTSSGWRNVLTAGVLAFGTCTFAQQPATERRYLSGHGPTDAVPWEFSVTAGRRAGEWTTIPVPSNWEQQGFGGYDYGEGQRKNNEHGLYRLQFAVPPEWKGQRIRLVFEGVMTDATVKVNGRPAGPTHIGAFYQFHYDLTTLVKWGTHADNLLEVDVAKTSSDPLTDDAERRADYWVFGGIFRPVWLEATPQQAIEHTAINALADGSFMADVTLADARNATRLDAQILSADGRSVGSPFSVRVPSGGAGRVRLTTQVKVPQLWTAETPHLYTVQLTLRNGEIVLHTTTERFGFRTFEVRPGDGLYLNGQRILLKGVNRHSFRPDTARALTREDCYDDARLIKAMNMNAVRMSHYPPDEAFLEACDELGLYVLDELSGWQHAHGTVIGRLLIREMLERDVNHPSILFWDNGNEGGWNRELDGEFAFYDPQARRVLHPWELHDDVDTKHYPIFADLSQRLKGPHLVMPTEFMHGLYDGGAGAGLEDYWTAIAESKFGAGGFIWVFADEGVARTDQGGRIDVYSTYAPDGIVGPRHEKEGSFHTVRDVWSPIEIISPTLDTQFTGQLTVHNHYDFTTLDRCRFEWRLVRFPAPSDLATVAITPVTTSQPLNRPPQPAVQVLAKGNSEAPAIAPHGSGILTLPLPADWAQADALALTAVGPDQQEIWTWTWPTPVLGKHLAEIPARTGLPSTNPTLQKTSGAIELRSGDCVATFDAATGLLRNLRRGAKISALTNGPRLAVARPEAMAAITWLPFAKENPAAQTRELDGAQLANVVQLELPFDPSFAYAAFKLEISPDGKSWKTVFDASRRSSDGQSYHFPPQPVQAVRWSNVVRSDGQPLAVKAVRLGYAPTRFAVASTPCEVTTGSGRDPQGGEANAWLEARGGQGLERVRWTLRSNGTLKLDYRYTLDGEFLYHGITFDHPEEQMTSLQWLGAGPYRVWQNRRRGTWLGVHRIERHDLQPGTSWQYPEFQGYFGALRWARLETVTGPLTFTSSDPNVFLRVGTPRINHQNTTVDFPAGDLSILQAIPGMGSKFITPEKSGPSGQPARASGHYEGSLLFDFGVDLSPQR